MASATVLGTSTTGTWPRSGDLGYYIKYQAAGSAAMSSLPAGVTCGWDSLPLHRQDTSGSPNLMMAPDGTSRLEYSWGGYAGKLILFNSPNPIIVSVYAYVGNATYGPASWAVRNAADDSVLATVTDTVPSTAGFWFTATIQGAVKIVPVNTDMRVFGLIFTSAVAPGRLLCFEAGRSGLFR